jgi:hypothetical protein
LIEVTSMVPWKMNPRLSVRMVTARNALSLLCARSMVLRCWEASGSNAGGRPPWEPLAARVCCWSVFSGIVAVIRRCRR